MTTATIVSAIRTESAYQQLLRLAQDAKLIASSASLLSWDQETMMPDGGVEYRSRQMAMLAKLAHDHLVDPRVGDLLAACEGDRDLMAAPHGDAAANIREIRRDYDRATKLPSDLVEEMAKTASVAQHEWAAARKESSFSRFKPWLRKNIELLRRKAECLGVPRDGEPWDALADEYEPGMTAAQIETLFTPLRSRLKKLLDDLLGSSKKPSNAFNEIALPIEAQKKFVRFIAEAIGFDFKRGRLDTSTHPFCGGTHCNDVRLTTRFHDVNVNDALGSTMHECGHGIYEQGLLFAHVGTPLGESVSLGIHESQSRMWENQVGRSLPFWKWLYPKLGEFFGSATKGLSLEDVYGGANVVEPGFIRVEADEATYNMHIMIRFELERAILRGDLDVDDIPETWNAKYKDYLGLTVPDDRRGCLQDVHWSSASMGYFPTYTLGNLYAAQIFEKVMQEIPDLHRQFEKGKFDDLRHWLNRNIHAHGRRYLPDELCQRVTGKPLSADPLMRHLEGKLRPLYGA